MKKFASLAMSLAVLFSALMLPLQVNAASTQKITVTAEKNAIREKASATSKQLVTAKKGHTFTVVGYTTSFWKVSFKKKNDSTEYTGYVLKKDSKESVAKTKTDEKPKNPPKNQTGNISSAWDGYNY